MHEEPNMTSFVTYEHQDSIARIIMDDGKVNVMSETMLDALGAAFDEAERDGAVTILSGREGVFSAGFDLKVLASEDAGAVHRMMLKGANLALRIMTFPRPVVCICTGHCMPMGVFLLLASDVRIGADGPFLIGLNEVAIGLTLPAFAVELARTRMTPPWFNRALVTGERIGPAQAVEAGFLDMLAPPAELEARAMEYARQLATLDMPSHAATKMKVRGPATGAVRSAIEAEITIEAAGKRIAERAAQAG